MTYSITYTTPYGNVIRESMANEPEENQKALDELEAVLEKHKEKFADMDINGFIEDAIADGRYLVNLFLGE